MGWQEEVRKVLHAHLWSHTATTHCACGWREPLAQLALERWEVHVTAALAPVVAAERARALREAADDMDLSEQYPPGWSGSVSVECRNAEGAAESWLRFRADAIEAEAGER